MKWTAFSLHFKQIYEGGYRYLDKCGEFILAAEKFNLMSAETNISGAKLTIPELGILVQANTQELSVMQELRGEDSEGFFQLVTNMVKTYSELFSPSRIESTGFASKSFLPFKSHDAALAKSLELGDKYNLALAKTVEMVPSQKKLDCNFTSGSFNFHILTHPVTFSPIGQQTHNAPGLSTDGQKKRLARLNRKAERVDHTLAHAIMLELDLVEFNPPADSLKKDFSALKKKEAAVQAALFAP